MGRLYGCVISADTNAGVFWLLYCAGVAKTHSHVCLLSFESIVCV